MRTRSRYGLRGQPRPRRLPEFDRILADLKAMHDRKGADYDQPGLPYANVRGAAEWGVPPWVGALVRAHDKIRRLQKVAGGGALTNESAEDSFMDLAVYSIIGLILYRESKRGCKGRMHPRNGARPSSRFRRR